jgi:histidine triad (HIT) family protein
MSTTCLFCRIASGEISVARVAERESCLAFRDIAPQAPVHVLIIPRTHASSLNDSSANPVLADLLALARDVALQEGIAESGYRVVVNTNDDGGQSVAHLHLHVLGGRALRWPPG